MDSSHLEKMGRELRCPICLSLLNSAVSLNCNHVFCNLCIEKSMKSASSCPVCTVPYRRREVRPAPHMDNLVSIYKSMEVSSSVNVFGPQTVAASELSGGKNQPGADMIRESGKTCSETPDLHNQRKLKGKRFKRSSKSNNKISSPVPVRPSFPTKKRVQVPKHPLPETPTQPTKHEVNLGDHTKNEPQSSVVQNEVTILNKNGELEFCPFFWLREEEDADKSSQPTDKDPVMDTPPAVPCFSDIKDSDDELQCSMTPENGLSIASHNADLFDSEMFEWTQRACSPELCSTPVKKENEETVRCEGIPGKEDKTKSGGDEPDNRENIIAQKEADKMVVNLVTSVCPRSQYFANDGRVTRPNKRTKKASESYKSNRARRTKGIYINSNNIAEDNIQEEKFDIVSNPGNSPNLKRKPNKRVKKVCQDPILRETMPKSVSTLDEGAELLKSSESSKNKQAKTTKLIASEVLVEDYKQEEKCDTIGNPGSASSLKLNPKKRVRKVCLDPCGTETMPENFSILAEGTKPPNQGDRSMLVVDLSGSFDDKECNGKNNNTTAQRQRDCARRSKSRKLNSVHDIQSQSNRPKAFTRGSDYRVFDLAFESRENEIGSLMDLEGDKKLERSKEVKLLSIDISKVTSVKDGSIHNSAKETQLFGKLQRSSDSSEKEKTRPILNGILRKCEINTNKIQCSFCQSTEDGEASGVMVHYLHGKPVIVHYNGEANIIHVHRNCAEWAPNVYFEDDNAINLEAELARSQRIKCGSCGLKGAALGCYEKSCRRSFHVPCAKLIAQCRWDNDNFVMLCPSHASSKLPNEISESQPKPKKKRLPRQLPINQPQVVKQHSGTSSCWNFRGLSGKLVLCCSALTVAEKVTVSEFEKLSGVTVLTNWDSRVTHLIASTDENGACRRTLKFLMGILEGKWILSIEWVKACLKAMEYVDEQLYEIDVDIHGLQGGPRLGRLRVINKQPKPLEGYKFYFAGDFQPSYKGYLHDLVIAAGGIVLHRKPISGNNKAQSSTFIIYSLELPDKCKPNKRNLIISRRRSDAEAVASACHASVATNSWILNSIAACKLQNLAE